MTTLRLAALSLLLINQSRAQTGPATTRGVCSPATTGNNNTFTFNCGIGKEQGQAILSIVNRILANQIDPAAVMAKLDEIQRGVDEIRERSSPRRISEQDFTKLAKILTQLPAQKVEISFLSANEESRQLAERFRALILTGGWDCGPLIPMMPFAAGPLPGILIRARESTKAAEVFLNAIANLGFDVKGQRAPNLAPDTITVAVLAKP